MLQSIRDKTSGLIAMIIVGLLIVTFAFWGVNYYFDQGGDVTAISVNDTDLDLREYQRVYQNIRRQWQATLESGAASLDDEQVKKQTIESLIERELVNQVNAELGLRVSAAQVRDVIAGLEAFQGERGFDSFLYERSIAQLGYTPRMFEMKVEEDMRSEQLQSALVETSFATKQEITQIASLQHQTRDITYTVLSSDKLKENMEVTDEEIQSFYDANPRDFLELERVRIAYIDLSLQKIANELELSEDDLLAYYTENKANYDVDEQRKICHITIATGETPTEGQITAATEKAQELIGIIKSGTSFDELSESLTRGSGPDVEISELGYMSKGIMSAEVDEVMFSIDEGQLSDPIVTPKSVDVIKVEKIKGGVNNTFENVREQVEQAYRLSLAEEQFYEATDQLANLAYEHPDTLEIAAEELGVTISESEFFNRISQNDPLISDRKIVDASFSDEVLSGNNSELIEVGDNRVFVLRVLAHEAEKRKPLEDVRERVITRMKYERARDQVREKGESIVAELKAGRTQEEVASQFEIEWTTNDAIKRDNVSTNRSVLRTAFKMGRPDENETLVDGSSLGSGDYAVVIVKAVNDPDPSELTEEEMAPIQSQLQQFAAASNWNQLIKSVRSQSSVNIYSERL